MGEICIVHGIIVTKDVDASKSLIKALPPLEIRPWLRTEMFSIGAQERGHFYENPAISFAATYKNLEGGELWDEFLLEFEYILAQTRFTFARLRLDTEFLGDYEFFWGSKQDNWPDRYKNYNLIECPQWHFGSGFRNMWGGLVIKSDPQALPYNFEYPLKFDEETKNHFNQFIPTLNQYPLNTKIYPPKNFDDSFMFIVIKYLELNCALISGRDSTGLFITRLREIVPLTTPNDFTQYPTLPFPHAHTPTQPPHQS